MIQPTFIWSFGRSSSTSPVVGGSALSDSRHSKRQLNVLLVFIAVVVLAVAPPMIASGDEPLKFNRDIRPLLSDRCFHCHGPDAHSREADLRLDLREVAIEDRGGYQAISPGDPQGSDVWERITSDDEYLVMPPPDGGKPLTEQEQNLIREWIEQGAPYEEHWAYAPLVSPATDQPLSETIDHWVAQALDQKGLDPNPPADDITLVRRLYFDLLGLPPTAQQVDDYLNNTSPQKYSQLVDQLLDSPHFGERMAMYWLDLVRYADTVGYHGDQDHAISPYRDWVIHSFNQDMPFDQFSIEQLAGDLLADPSNDQLIASGYNRLLQTSHEGGVQQKEYLAKYSADRVRNFSLVWLGATMGCCECHDHKYDPLSQKDFYSLAAFFADIDDLQSFRGTNTLPTKREPEIEVHSPLDRMKLERLREQLAECHEQIDSLAEPTGSQSSQQEQLLEQQERLVSEIESLEKSRRRTMIAKAIEPRDIRILARGDWMDESGPIVQPAVPEVLPDLSLAVDAGTEGRASRLDLARWLFEENRSLTARVFVNRLWYLYFGAGLSRSLEDSGNQGRWPTHPELLDALASEFVESQWHVKPLIRQIVLSQTYRQSSIPTAHQVQLDPENLWLSRQSRSRLPAEMIRDQALASSGLLVDELGGPSARPYQPSGYYSHLNFPTRAYYADEGPSQYRRGVYVHWQRQFLHPMLRAFDAPSREECTAQRPTSNTPLAALTLLNDPSFVEAARFLAQQTWHEAPQSIDDPITWMFRRVLSRRPERSELELLSRLYAEQLVVYQERPDAARKLLSTGLAPRDEDLPAAELAAMTFVARAILNTNEAITRN